MESEKQTHFIELRAAGQSYDKIAKQLSVSKTTLIKWSKEHCNEIKNAKALEIERIREEYLLGHQHRTQVLGAQLCQITEELLKRDLEEVPTWRLYEIQRKVIVEIEKDPAEIEFTQEILKKPMDQLAEMYMKTEKWTG
jgi:DNA-binding XRE family transcriptional regulator